MTPSSYILLAIAAGSPPACSFIVSEVRNVSNRRRILFQLIMSLRLQTIPLLLNQYEVREQVTPRQFILNTLNKMVQAGLHGYTEQNGNEEVAE